MSDGCSDAARGNCWPLKPLRRRTDMNDEAIKRIERTRHDLLDDGYTPNDWLKQELQKLLSLLRSQPSDWIPVSEGPPDVPVGPPNASSKNVWIIFGGQPDIGYYTNFDGWRVQGLRFQKRMKQSKITHWKPIVLPSEEKPTCAKCRGSGELTPFDINKPAIPCTACKDDVGEFVKDIEDTLEVMPDDGKFHRKIVEKALAHIAQLQQENKYYNILASGWKVDADTRREQIAELKAEVEEKDKLLFAYESVRAPKIKQSQEASDGR